RQECTGRLLSSHPGPLRWPQGGGGDGPQDRRARVPTAEVRRGVRTAGDGSGRGGVSAAAAERAGPQGQRVGVSVGAGDFLSRHARAAVTVRRPFQLPTDSHLPIWGAPCYPLT